MAAPAGADDERADPVDRREALVVVVVAGEDDVGAPGGKRAPERCDRLVGAVQTGAEARVVPVRERAAAGMGGEVGGEPALLGRARAQPPAGRQFELRTTTCQVPSS